ncbi:MAG: hypothetical protein AAFV53_05125 [Myxococcota bacterium]
MEQDAQRFGSDALVAGEEVEPAAAEEGRELSTEGLDGVEGALEPLEGVDLQELSDGRGVLGWDTGDEGRDGRRWIGGAVDRVPPCGVGQRAGEGEEDHDADGEEVCGGAGVLPQDLLWGGERGGVRAAGELGVECATGGEPEVEDGWVSFPVDEDVRGLEVLMKQPGEVDTGEGFEELEDDGLEFFPGDDASCAGEPLALDVLHDDEVAGVDESIVEHSDDAGEPGPPKGSDFAPNAEEVGVGERGDELEGDLIVGVVDLCQPDFTEAAGAELLLQGIPARYDFADAEVRGGRRLGNAVRFVGAPGIGDVTEGRCGTNRIRVPEDIQRPVRQSGPPSSG